MNVVFSELIRKFVLVFFDDILVYSPDLNTHVRHLSEVMSILEKHQFYAKKGKCALGVQLFEYLGHIISGEGVRTDPENIESMVEWLRPTNIKGLRGFLGLTGYYSRLIKGYRLITRPLTQLVKKDNFKWGEDAEVAFEKLKKLMMEAPVLSMSDFSQPFVLETDVCVQYSCNKDNLLIISIKACVLGIKPYQPMRRNCNHENSVEVEPLLEWHFIHNQN